MIEHVDPWAITIAVVCAPLAAVAVSGVLDVIRHRPRRLEFRSRAVEGASVALSAPRRDPHASPDLAAASYSTDDQA